MPQKIPPDLTFNPLFIYIIRPEWTVGHCCIVGIVAFLAAQVQFLKKRSAAALHELCSFVASLHDGAAVTAAADAADNTGADDDENTRSPVHQPTSIRRP